MAFGFREIWNERFDEDGTLSLTDKWGRRCTNCFRTGHFHSPKEEFGEPYDDPLKDTVII